MRLTMRCGVVTAIFSAACAGGSSFLGPSTIGRPVADATIDSRNVAGDADPTLSAAKRDRGPAVRGETRVTHGFVSAIPRTSGAFWSIGGTKGFKFNGNNDNQPLILIGVDVFVPGATYDLGFYAIGPFQGTVKYKGVEYVPFGIDAQTAGVVQFSTPAFTLPPVTESSLRASVPFTASGSLTYSCCSPFESFTVDLTGRGTAEAHFEGVPALDEYNLLEVRYAFTGAPSP